MRYDKIRKILELARALSSTAEGLALDEMCRVTSCSRRTVERTRDINSSAVGPSKKPSSPPGMRKRLSDDQEFPPFAGTPHGLWGLILPARGRLLRTTSSRLGR